MSPPPLGRPPERRRPRPPPPPRPGWRRGGRRSAGTSGRRRAPWQRAGWSRPGTARCPPGLALRECAEGQLKAAHAEQEERTGRSATARAGACALVRSRVLAWAAGWAGSGATIVHFFLPFAHATVARGASFFFRGVPEPVLDCASAAAPRVGRLLTHIDLGTGGARRREPRGLHGFPEPVPAAALLPRAPRAPRPPALVRPLLCFIKHARKKRWKLRRRA